MLWEEHVSDSGPPLPWYADGLSFACTQCGNCCSGAPGHVWVDSDEIAQIAAHVGMTPEAFNRRHVRRVGRGRSLLEKRDGDCEFLKRCPDGTTQCLIHGVRPTQCRTWPFWKSNLQSPETWQAAARDCPGMDQGPRVPLVTIQTALCDNGSRPL